MNTHNLTCDTTMISAHSVNPHSCDTFLLPGGYPPTPELQDVDPITSFDDMFNRSDALIDFSQQVRRYSYAILCKFSARRCWYLMYECLEREFPENKVRYVLDRYWRQLTGTWSFRVEDAMQAWRILRPHWQEVRRRKALLDALRQEFFAAIPPIDLLRRHLLNPSDVSPANSSR